MRPEPGVQIRLGVAAAFVITAVTAAIAFLPDPFFRQVIYTTTFDNAEAITSGSPVVFKGATIGKVRSAELDPARNLFNVRLGVRRDWRPPACTFVRIVETNPLIAPRIEIADPEVAANQCAAAQAAAGCLPLAAPTDAKRPLEGCRRAPNIFEVAAMALAQTTKTIASANLILAQADTLLKGFTGDGKGKPGLDAAALSRDVTTTAASLSDITARLDRTLNDARAQEIDQTLTNAKVLTGKAAEIDVKRLNTTVDTANALLGEIRSTLATNKQNLDAIANQGAGLTGESRELLQSMSASITAASSNMERASENLEALSEKLKADPTYAVRGAKYADPPPPGGNR